MKNIIKNTILITIVSIIIFLILYFVNPALNFDFTFTMIVSTIVYLFFLFKVAREEKQKLGGSLEFGEAFLATFSTYALSSFLVTLFTFLMFKFDPSMIDILKEVSIKTMSSTWRMMGISEDKIALQLEEQKDSLSNLASFGTLMVSWLGSLFFPGLIYALIVSFFAKKKTA